MGGHSLTVFRNSFLTIQSSILGRLVTNAANPTQDFWPSTGPQLGEGEVEIRPFEALSQTAISKSHSAQSESLRAKLSRLFLNDPPRGLASNELNTTLLRRYALLQPQRHFRTMCTDNETRRWIEEALRDCPIFLIVGFVTVTDATVQHSGQQRMESVATSAGAPAALTTGGHTSTATRSENPTSPGDGGSVTVPLNGNLRFIASGERVIGVQYRKLKFKLFQKRVLDKAFLENNPNRWEMFLGTRAGEEEDVIEAELQNSITIDELECEAAMEGETVIFEQEL